MDIAHELSDAACTAAVSHFNGSGDDGTAEAAAEAQASAPAIAAELNASVRQAVDAVLEEQVAAGRFGAEDPVYQEVKECLQPVVMAKLAVKLLISNDSAMSKQVVAYVPALCSEAEQVRQELVKAAGIPALAKLWAEALLLDDMMAKYGTLAAICKALLAVSDGDDGAKHAVIEELGAKALFQQQLRLDVFTGSVIVHLINGLCTSEPIRDIFVAAVDPAPVLEMLESGSCVSAFEAVEAVGIFCRATSLDWSSALLTDKNITGMMKLLSIHEADLFKKSEACFESWIALEDGKHTARLLSLGLANALAEMIANDEESVQMAGLRLSNKLGNGPYNAEARAALEAGGVVAAIVKHGGAELAEAVGDSPSADVLFDFFAQMAEEDSD